jgi:hypothetical protein
MSPIYESCLLSVRHFSIYESYLYMWVISLYVSHVSLYASCLSVWVMSLCMSHVSLYASCLTVCVMSLSLHTHTHTHRYTHIPGGRSTKAALQKRGREGGRKRHIRLVLLRHCKFGVLINYTHMVSHMYTHTHTHTHNGTYASSCCATVRLVFWLSTHICYYICIHTLHTHKHTFTHIHTPTHTHNGTYASSCCATTNVFVNAHDNIILHKYINI